MIRPLRRRHRLLITTLAVVLPLLFAWALRGRHREAAAPAPLPAPLAAQLAAGDQGH